MASAFLAASASAAAAQGCLPPLEPYAYEPPRDDPELRQMVNEEYQAYMLEAEDYLRCLQAEQARASTEARDVLDRWIGYFGEEARLQIDPIR